MTSILRRYSDAAPPDLRNIVLGIPGGDFGRFRTPALRNAGGSTREHWLQAWKNPQTNLWTADRHERLVVTGPDGREEYVGRSQSRMIHSCCFFDILHACFQYVHDEKNMGAVEWPGGEDQDGMEDFRSIAKKAALPVDIHGILHPAAFGNILTPGDFDEEAFALAAQTLQRRLVRVDATDTQINFLDGLLRQGDVPEIVEEKRLVDKNIERMKLVRVFNDVGQAMEDAYDAIRRVQYRDFRPEWLIPGTREDDLFPRKVNYIMGTLFTLGLRPTIGWMYGTDVTTTDRYVNRMCRKFEKVVVQLPDCPEKKLLQDFAIAARATYRLEKAAFMYAESKKGEEAHFKKGLKAIDLAKSEGVVSPADVEKLKFDYLNGNFPVPNVFIYRLYESKSDIQKILSRQIKSLQNKKDMAFEP